MGGGESGELLEFNFYQWRVGEVFSGYSLMIIKYSCR